MKQRLNILISAIQDDLDVLHDRQMETETPEEYELQCIYIANLERIIRDLGSLLEMN